jgi:hypothetical protein
MVTFGDAPPVTVSRGRSPTKPAASLGACSWPRGGYGVDIDRICARTAGPLFAAPLLLHDTAVGAVRIRHGEGLWPGTQR